jgi:hypothetical protein
MPRQQPSYAERYATEHDRQLQLIGDAFAKRLGPPPGGTRMSDAALVEKFLLRDPAVTPEMVEQAKQQGATPDDITNMLHPFRAPTYTEGVVGTEAQIKEANRLAKLAAKKQAEETPPDPNAFLSGSLGSLMPQQPPAQPMLGAGGPEPAAGEDWSEMPMQEGGY